MEKNGVHVGWCCFIASILNGVQIPIKRGLVETVPNAYSLPGGIHNSLSYDGHDIGNWEHDNRKNVAEQYIFVYKKIMKLKHLVNIDEIENRVHMELFGRKGVVQ